MGFLDTIKETIIYYKDNLVKDTVHQLAVRVFNGTSEVIESKYEVEGNGHNILLATIKRIFDSSRHILQQITYRKDTIEEEKKYSYDKSGHLVSSETIELKQKNSSAAKVYDTIHSVFTYTNGVNTEIVNTNGSGSLLNEITNIYSGKDKVASYQIFGKDTFQTTTFSKEGKFDKQVERYKNTLLITTLSSRGRIYLVLTENLNNKMKSKEVRKYDPTNGYLVESRRYFSFPVAKK